MIFLISIIIKEIGKNLIKHLTFLFNGCIITSQGIFSVSFKFTKVVPVFKKGNPNSLDNYRSNSIMPLFGKIFKILVENSLSQYFETNNLLIILTQFDFREGRSAAQALSKIVDDVVEGFEQGNHVGFTLCYLSKVFDCVFHNLLNLHVMEYVVCS